MAHQKTFDEAIEAAETAIDRFLRVDAQNAVLRAYEYAVTPYETALATQAEGRWRMICNDYRHAEYLFDDALNIAEHVRNPEGEADFG